MLIYALVLLIIALAFYYYKGQEAITFIETIFSKEQKAATLGKHLQCGLSPCAGKMTKKFAT